MTTLTLSLKRKWFEMIRDGVKLEEYREIKPYYEKRLLNYKAIAENIDYLKFMKYVMCIPIDICSRYPKGFDKLVFTLGYPKSDDTSRRLEFKNPKIRFGEGRPEWGAEPRKIYFVITWEK